MVSNVNVATSGLLSPGQLSTVKCFYFVLYAPKNSSHRVEPKIPVPGFAPVVVSTAAGRTRRAAAQLN